MKDGTTTPPSVATVADTLGFAWRGSPSSPIYLSIGCTFAFLQGLGMPALAFFMARSLTVITSASTAGIGDVSQLAISFAGLAVYIGITQFVHLGCLEFVGGKAHQQLRLEWFQALLRQDIAYFDSENVSGLATNIGPAAERYRRGFKRLGEALQFTTVGLGGVGVALWSNWRVALVVLAVAPLVALSGYFLVVVNQARYQKQASAYQRAGAIAHQTIASIRTVLSLNALPTLIEDYKAATAVALTQSVGYLSKIGLAHSFMIATILLMNCVLTLYGMSLIYNEVASTGCNPSGSTDGAPPCVASGESIFGSLLGVMFAASGLSRVGTAMEGWTTSRTVIVPALKVIQRQLGAKEERIYEAEDDNDVPDDEEENAKMSAVVDIEQPKVNERRLKAILPQYRIDAASTKGLTPLNVQGRITFRDVSFHYPTRPTDLALNMLNLDIEPGKRVALVGPSGGGKSTTVALVERFYDPTLGSVQLDGVDLRDINVAHLRSLIGYVGQEPVLFATTIGENIRYGNPAATQEQIEEAARKANAHNFICTFGEGYDTSVGDKGAKLSGGQKQRIALARVLIANPALLILDEATSALDNHSELIVQQALDQAVADYKRTTIIIAHRLSTIRNCDLIVVIANGAVVEKGTHDELMAKADGCYRNLVNKQGNDADAYASDEGKGVVWESEESSSRALSTQSSLNMSARPIQLAFRDVKFAYPTRRENVILDNFNLDIRQGETIALCGPSGQGKSTIVALVERFYDPIGGSIHFNGHELKDLHVAGYRDQIGYVGQEPVLFNDTIANNIALGAPGASRDQIEEAARHANAHDFIMEFADGYETFVGENGAGLSGGQKQRVAIARALIKKPKLLILDEATSALDTDSEKVVQEALDRLMESPEHTAIVIAHRLTTIRHADRIAFVGDGKVKEIGSHDELMAIPDGNYRQLVDARDYGAVRVVARRRSTMSFVEMEADLDDDCREQMRCEEKASYSAARARKMASPDVWYLCVGAASSLVAGAVVPSWGFLFALTLGLLYSPVPVCSGADCQAAWEAAANELRQESFLVGLYWVILIVCAITSTSLVYWAIGMAGERLNKRVRDESFAALVRQEVGFFDKRSIGELTSELQEDAARIQAFSGEPIQAVCIAFSSAVIAVVVSFFFMWPFALLAMFCVPLVGFSSAVKVKIIRGTDEGDAEATDSSSGRSAGIIVEALLNMRTVAALSLEKSLFERYKKAIQGESRGLKRVAVISGFVAGMSESLEIFVTALLFWWGGYLVATYPESFDALDYLISNSVLIFGILGLTSAFAQVTDKAEVEASAGRIFYLLDRKSEIDPLSDAGKKLN